MDKVGQVFGNLDQWRKFPDYQLERRADLFFSLYLPEVLEAVLGVPMRSDVVPEFPLKQAESHRSDKVDYLAATADGTRLVLVELKTDCSSARWEQFLYLCRGAQRSAEDLIGDLRAISGASKAKTKYKALIGAAERLGLAEGGATKISRPHTVVLIAPSREYRCHEEADELFKGKAVPFHVVTFADFRDVVLRHPDALSARFAESLDRWKDSAYRGRCRAVDQA